ncbi:MAG: sugar ABC transporter permease, partial [Firmicutes bacterium]|nr:sugar ABC transporter permease [Bacillota bacterium]
MKRFGDTRIFIVLAVLPAIILFTVFYLLPMGALIVTSLFRWDSIRIGEFIGFQNYVRMFN